MCGLLFFFFFPGQFKFEFVYTINWKDENIGI